MYSRVELPYKYTFFYFLESFGLDQYERWGVIFPGWTGHNIKSDIRCESEGFFCQLTCLLFLLCFLFTGVELLIDYGCGLKYNLSSKVKMLDSTLVNSGGHWCLFGIVAVSQSRGIRLLFCLDHWCSLGIVAATHAKRSTYFPYSGSQGVLHCMNKLWNKNMGVSDQLAARIYDGGVWIERYPCVLTGYGMTVRKAWCGVKGKGYGKYFLGKETYSYIDFWTYEFGHRNCLYINCSRSCLKNMRIDTDSGLRSLCFGYLLLDKQQHHIVHVKFVYGLNGVEVLWGCFSCVESSWNEITGYPIVRLSIHRRWVGFTVQNNICKSGDYLVSLCVVVSCFFKEVYWLSTRHYMHQMQGCYSVKGKRKQRCSSADIILYWSISLATKATIGWRTLIWCRIVNLIHSLTNCKDTDKKLCEDCQYYMGKDQQHCKVRCYIGFIKSLIWLDRSSNNSMVHCCGLGMCLYSHCLINIHRSQRKIKTCMLLELLFFWEV